MRRVFPFLLAAAAGAVVFQLVAARAQVDRLPVREPATAIRVYQGTSDRGDLREAIDEASSRAVRDLPGADRMVRYRVREITGETGGIRGASTLHVSIEVPSDEARVPERPEPPLEGDNLADDIRRSLKTEVVVPRDLERGDPVPIEFVLTNTSDHAIRIPLNTGQKYDFEVYRDNRLIWRWSQGRFFTQVLGNTVIKPNEEVTYKVTWDQRNNDGIRVPAGQYQVRAYIPTRIEDFRVGNSTSLTISGR